MRSKLYLLFLLIFFGGVELISQESYLDSLYNIAPESPDTARILALDNLAHEAIYINPEFAKKIIDEEYILAERINKSTRTAGVHNTFAIYHFYQSNIDSAVFFFTKALEEFEKSGKRKRVASLLNNIGLVLTTQGDFDGAIDHYYRSLKIKEELADSVGIYVTYNNIGNAYVELGQHDRARELYDKVLARGRRIEDERFVADALYNLGGIAESPQGALKLYQEALPIFQKINDNYQTMGCLTNMGATYFDLGDYDKAIEYYDQAQPLAGELGAIDQEALILLNRGDILSQKGRHNEAIQSITTALEIYDTLGYVETYVDGLQFLYEAQENKGDFRSAYYNFQEFHVKNDSLRSLLVEQNISELETKYETEKKETQIALLSREAEIDDLRKRNLWISLALLLIAGLATIYAIMQRNRKKQALLTAEKQAEIEKRKATERELDFKKQELTAKVLQLASKNEFLQKLEEEVVGLKSSVDNEVNRTSDRISRMIQHDATDESEWDQFSKEFGSVHQGFVERLTDRYGTLSKSEVRLASLLKMNLSSKDICNILRISDEGIKKARYRLRRKMNLDKGDDLQGIIITI